MAQSPVHVTVTGAGGQIGYSILFRIASGQLLGEDQPIVLRLLEIEPAMKVLEGVCMELDDGAFPLLHDIVATSDLKTAFDGTSWALLVGSVPRKAGMERGDLLNVNGGIFKPQGQGHRRARRLRRPRPRRRQPLQHELPHRPLQRAGGPRRALVRHDEARREPGQGAAGPQGGLRWWRDVTNLAIWGNHSATQFPDFANARIGGKPAPEVIGDEGWLRGDFITTVQKRGAAIIDARGSSSAASAAAAAIDTVVSLRTETPAGDCFSVAVPSTGPVRRARGPPVRLPRGLRRQGRVVGGRGVRP